MKYLCVNDYDMAYIEVGKGRPLVCVHGTFNDFRCWSGPVDLWGIRGEDTSRSASRSNDRSFCGSSSSQSREGNLTRRFAEAEGLDVSSDRRRIPVAAEKIAGGDIDGGLKSFVESINGQGTWPLIPQSVKQELRDNARTLLEQINDQRQQYRRAEAEAISVPTLFILGEKDTGVIAGGAAGACRGCARIEDSNHRQCSAPYDSAGAGRH